MRNTIGRPSLAIFSLGVGLAASLSQALAQNAPSPTTAPTFAIGAPVASQSGTTVQASRGFTEYLGGGYLTLSESCESYGWSGTHQIMVRAQPQGLPGNHRNMSQLALFFSTGTIAMKYDADEMDMGGVEVEEASYVWNGPWIPEIPTMMINYLSRYGDYIPSGDENLSSVYLTFVNFNEHPGCVANARVSLGRV